MELIVDNPRVDRGLVCGCHFDDPSGVRFASICHSGMHIRRTTTWFFFLQGRRKEVLSGETFKEFLKGSEVKLVVLNACHSEALAVSLSEVVPAAIGTTRKIRDVAARRFTRHFYSALKDDASVKDAFEAALKKEKPSSSPAYMHAGRTN